MGLGAGHDGHLRLSYGVRLASYNRRPRRPRSARSDVSRPTALRDALRVKPGTRIRLEKLDAGATFGHDKASSVEATARQMARLRDLQDRMWAEAKHSVLVVLQGIDAAGKDGTIAKVMEAFNPQGCPVTLVQGAVRRGARARLPVAGPQAHARARARSASSTARTTRTCSSSGSTISCRRASGRSATTRSTTSSGCWRTAARPSSSSSCTIDRDEQRKRFQERYDDPTKRWKFSLGDLEERKLWDSYQAAFDEALSRTSTPGRRGTSSRPTGTGSATSRCRRSSPTRWPA